MDGTCAPKVSVLMKAQAIVKTGRSGTQSMGNGSNESTQGRLFGGDDMSQNYVG